MTMDGAIGKTAILLLITACGAAWAWQQCIGQLMATYQAGGAALALQTVRQTSMVRAHLDAEHLCFSLRLSLSLSLSC